MCDGGATGAADDRGGAASVKKEIKAGNAERAGVVPKDAGGAEATEDSAVADVV